MSFNIIPVASEYQEIHPYSVVNVSNIKINTKMMWRCIQPHRVEEFYSGKGSEKNGFISKGLFSLFPIYSTSVNGDKEYTYCTHVSTCI